jgi:hypothetical protein
MHTDTHTHTHTHTYTHTHVHTHTRTHIHTHRSHVHTHTHTHTHTHINNLYLYMCLQDTIKEMPEQQLRQVLSNLATDHPRYVASYVLPPPQPWVRILSDEPPAWCSCGQCIVMVKRKMNTCCGRTPCLTMHHTFHQLALSPDVIEVANILNWSVQFNNVATYETRIFRNQAYRNIILWMWSKLGAGIRRVLPSCCVARIRWKYPAPDNVYTGYESFESDLED